MKDFNEIKSFFEVNQRMPSFEELKTIFNVSSKNTVSYRLERLIDGGLLDKNNGHLKFKRLTVKLITTNKQ